MRGGIREALWDRYRGVSVLCVVVALNSFGLGAGSRRCDERAAVRAGEGFEPGRHGIMDQRDALSAILHDDRVWLSFGQVRAEDADHPVDSADLPGHRGVYHRAGNLWQLLLSGALLGLGEGLGSPASTVFFADIAPPGMEGVTIGLLRTFGGVGTIAGALALGAIADVAGFPWALWVDAAILAASGIGLVLFVRETYRARRG